MKFFKIWVWLLAAVFVVMVFFRTLAVIQGQKQVPLVTLICTGDRGALVAMTQSLQDQGLVADSDFRLSMVPCTPPGTPRQAVATAVGQGATVLFVVDPVAVTVAQSSGLKVVPLGDKGFKEATSRLASQLRSLAH